MDTASTGLWAWTPKSNARIPFATLSDFVTPVLLAGESTANVEVHSKVQIDGLDKLAEMLAKSISGEPTKQEGNDGSGS